MYHALVCLKSEPEIVYHLNHLNDQMTMTAPIFYLYWRSTNLKPELSLAHPCQIQCVLYRNFVKTDFSAHLTNSSVQTQLADLTFILVIPTAYHLQQL